METNELINSLRTELAEAKEKNEVLEAECNRRIAPQTLNLNSCLVAGDPPEAMELRYMKDGVVYDPDELIKENAELKQANLELAANVEACCELVNMDMDSAIDRLFEIDNTESKTLLNTFAIENKIEGVQLVLDCRELNLSQGEIETIRLIKEQLQAQGDSK